MSENWSEVNSNADSEQGDGPWSQNGNNPADTIEETQPTSATADGASEGGRAAAEGGMTVAEGAAEQGAGVATAVAQSGDVVDDPGVFLGELARAMQATAGQERARILEDIDRRRSSQVDHIRERETAEADRMRELAAGDQAAIDTWAESEFQRIAAEKARRSDAVRADLDGSLEEHRSLISQEIERVETAIGTHRAEVVVFFDRLEQETDPVVLAQLATRRPAFPSLDAVAEPPGAPTPVAEPLQAAELVQTAEPVQVAEPAQVPGTGQFGEPSPAPEAAESTIPEAAAVASPAESAEAPGGQGLVGVMAPAGGAAGQADWDASGAEAAAAAEAVKEASADDSGAETTEPASEPAPPEESAEEAGKPPVQAPATAVVSTTPRPRSSVLQSVPALRPMGSWLGRHSNSDRPDFKD
jgi:hypothetical protein